MSRLKEVYVEKIGHDYDRINNSLWYLSMLSSQSAFEIDDYFVKGNQDFSHLNEFAQILKKYQLNDAHTFLTSPHFPYLPLFRALGKNSTKNIKHMSELALEMRLFRAELESRSSNHVLNQMRLALTDISKEFSEEQFRYNHINGLAA